MDGLEVINKLYTASDVLYIIDLVIFLEKTREPEAARTINNL